MAAVDSQTNGVFLNYRIAIGCGYGFSAEQRAMVNGKGG